MTLNPCIWKYFQQVGFSRAMAPNSHAITLKVYQGYTSNVTYTLNEGVPDLWGQFPTANMIPATSTLTTLTRRASSLDASSWKKGSILWNRVDVTTAASRFPR